MLVKGVIDNGWHLHNAFLRKKRPGRLVFPGLLAGLVLLGVCDQTPSDTFAYTSYQPPWMAVMDYSNEDEFVKHIESAVPPGSMIFQLPQVEFPEGSPSHLMRGYDHLEAYLQSKTLRWSFGAMKGRECSRWQSATASLPPDKFVQAL